MTKSKGLVLVIDDDDMFRFAIGKALRRLGYDVDEAPSGEDALVKFRSERVPDAALLDLRMKGIGGLEVLRRRGVHPTAVIVLTGHGTVAAAVEAMRLGAYSFLEKPVDAEELAPLLGAAIAETHRASTSVDSDPDVPPLIGESAAMQEIRRFIQTVGPTDETVTIFGETGTGKEVVARHLHPASRRKGPFVALNAAAIPRELFESELFGHKRGAFTGATADRQGVFREADGGTLFIDELGELPMELQAKLLRALETRRVRPVGESKEFPVDVRIVAATNRDIWADVQAGTFREDLFFRLQVFPIVLAPLRERRDDIVRLAEHLLPRIGANAKLDDSAVEALVAYDWPGNVRELMNVLRRAALFSAGDVLDANIIRRMTAASVFGQAQPRSATTPSSEAASLAEVERTHIERVLKERDGNVTHAAIALGIDRRTLQRKLKAYGMDES